MKLQGGKMTDEIISFPTEVSELEICVSCDGPTKIRKDEPVELRPCYIEGAGQLCGSCYRINIIQTKEFIEVLDRRRYG